MSDIKLDTREMDRIIKQSGLKARQVVNRMAFQIQASAVPRAPYRTGALRGSAKVKPTQSDNGVATVGFYTDYAAFVEFGTYKMAARPYLMPAVEEVAREFNEGNSWKEVVT